MSEVAIIGGGPAGLMAAEVLAQQGVQADVYDAMPSLGRKLLFAGKSGLNITHAEDYELFLSRYGVARDWLAPMLDQLKPDALCDWAHGLGIETFVGSSGHIFPRQMKASPLLRAWLQRLRVAGVRFHPRHRWIGWSDVPAGIGLRFDTPQGERSRCVDAVLLALGGASWPRLGSDGRSMALLAQRGVSIAPFEPANCGFDVRWSEHFRMRFAGQPLKTVVLSFTDAGGNVHRRQGEFVVSGQGIEGSLIYAFSAMLRDAIAARGEAIIELDLAPAKTLQRLIDEIAHPRGSRSMSSHLQSRAGIAGLKAGLLRECVSKEDFARPEKLADAIKALPLRLITARPIEEAISSAGGVRRDAIDEDLMLRALPGVFCAGEMLDWEAPTGGYLLNACFASGRAAAIGVFAYLKSG